MAGIQEHSNEEIVRFRQALLSWYDKEHRLLPWRYEVSAYRTWVSEIMLQQTRVEAVIPYFLRFMETLPALSDLAAAEDDLLHKLWEGLGYYSRVRNMKKCACVCMERYGGVLPASYEELLALPGIGPYTAGAIASIAYGEAVCAVDGNVMRVFARVCNDDTDIAKPAAKKQFQERAQAFLPIERPGDFNQALMELGALICLPNGEPKCALCPVQAYCRAYARRTQSQLPKRTAKKARRVEKRTVFVCVAQNRIQLLQRPDKGLLAGLYGFAMSDTPCTKRQAEERYPNAERIIRLREHTHIFSHVEWRMNAFLIVLPQGDPQFYTIRQIREDFAIPTAFRPFYEAACQWIQAQEDAA